MSTRFCACRGCWEFVHGLAYGEEKRCPACEAAGCDEHSDAPRGNGECKADPKARAAQAVPA